MLDLAGHWGKERVPQRRPWSPAPICARAEGPHRSRRGDRAAPGTPGFGFAGGEIWAVHTGWSGNHTHYAERMSTGEQVIGGGELLLPGEVVLGTAVSRTPRPGSTAAYGDGLDEVARRFHRYLRARPGPSRTSTGRSP